MKHIKDIDQYHVYKVVMSAKDTLITGIHRDFGVSEHEAQNTIRIRDGKLHLRDATHESEWLEWFLGLGVYHEDQAVVVHIYIPIETKKIPESWFSLRNIQPVRALNGRAEGVNQNPETPFWEDNTPARGIF